MVHSKKVIENRRKSIMSTIVNTVGLIASIITIATIFTTSSLATVFVWLIHKQDLIIPFATFALGVGLSLVVFVIFTLKSTRSSGSSQITQINDRVHYIYTVIDWIGKSKQSVLLCVNTLDSSRKGEEIEVLHKTLQEAKVSGKDVRIMAPKGIERVEAAYELTRVRSVPMKFLSYLEDEDFRFTIIDNNVAIVSIGVRDIPSNGCTVIISDRLNGLLKKYSDELWNRTEAIVYDVFLSEVVHELRDPSNPITNKRLAERLGIPLAEIERILSIASNS